MLGVIGTVIFGCGAFLIGVAMVGPTYAPERQSLFKATLTHPYAGYVGLGLIAVYVIASMFVTF